MGSAGLGCWMLMRELSRGLQRSKRVAHGAETLACMLPAAAANRQPVCTQHVAALPCCLIEGRPPAGQQDRHHQQGTCKWAREAACLTSPLPSGSAGRTESSRRTA